MKTVNFDVNIFGLNGETFKEPDGTAVNLKKIIGNAIFNSKAKTDAIRQADVAKKIYSSVGEIELEDGDFVMVEETMKEGFSCVVIQAFQQCIKLSTAKKAD